MASDAAKHHRRTPAAPPPRSLDVRKYAESRAAELESLQSVISTRLNDDFRSRRNKRRRTTGFNNNKNRRRQKLSKSEERENGEEEEKKKKMSRRVRRRIELKKNLETGFSVCGDGTKRLRTHVWYAKRFTMVKLWGFYLPLGLHGRGRGSRALLKWYKQGAVVHDASYYAAVQLEGPEDSLLSILSMLLVPSSFDHSEDTSKSILHGEKFGSAMLHHAGHDKPKAICPVTYMWQPFQQQDNGPGTEDKRTEENVKTESRGHLRRLWIWMHPSAFNEGYECLQLSCHKKMDETGVLIDCASFDGQLARLEVMGLKSFQLLRKILHPFASSLEHFFKLKKCSIAEDKKGFEIRQKNIIEKAEDLSSSAAVSLSVVDPRLLVGKRSEFDREADVASDQCGLIEDNNEDNPADNLHMKEEVLSTLQSQYQSNSSLSNCMDLWNVSKGVCPPLEENILCLERHKKSLDFFCVRDATSAKITSTEPQFSRLCPILLLRNTEQADLLAGYHFFPLHSFV